jgi:hypothetical protein
MAGAASSTTFPVLLGATEDWGLLLLVEGRLIASLACRLDVALAECRGGQHFLLEVKAVKGLHLLQACRV